MLVSASVTVLFGQAKVNDIDKVALLAKSHEEVVGFDITMDEVLGVDKFNSADLERGEEEVGGDSGGTGERGKARGTGG